MQASFYVWCTSTTSLDSSGTVCKCVKLFDSSILVPSFLVDFWKVLAFSAIIEFIFWSLLVLVQFLQLLHGKSLNSLLISI